MSPRAHIPTENLEIWREAAAENRELRLLQIGQIAKKAGASLRAGEEFTPDVLRLPAPSDPADPFTMALTVDEQLAFCRALLSVYPSFGQEGDPSASRQDVPISPRVARLEGSIFSRAFARFAPLLPGAKPLYLSSLTDLLEETAAGSADFALLPIEDAKGGRFLHFYEEFDRLELHISHTCDIPSEESGRSIRFALISRLYRPVSDLPCTPLMDCRLSGEDRGALLALLTAAGGGGATLYRLDSLPAPYPEDSFTYYPTFTTTDGGTLLEAYVTAFLPRAAVVGRYLHLKEGENI